MGILLCTVLCASRLVITEVLANPRGPSGAHQPEDRNEFIELYNTSNQAVDLHDAILDDGDSPDRLTAWTDPTILIENPALVINTTWLSPGQFAVILDSEYCDPNPTGGQVRPYRFGDGTLIITTRNTTIGNGLATTDPVTIVTVEGDTTTFGTPLNPSDSIPCDPGDGISWERISLSRPDSENNWAACRDPSGSTPGRENSVASLPDLALSDLALEDTALQPGQVFSFRVLVANHGAALADSWKILAWFDLNQNSTLDKNETFAELAGWPLPPGYDTVLKLSTTSPRLNTDLWLTALCPNDADTLNNRCRLSLAPARSRHILSLSYTSFSPDGDGLEDSLPIILRLPGSGGRLTISIFNLAGRPVRRLFSGRMAGEGIFTWDGRKENGEPAPTGIYVLWLEYRYQKGTVTEKLPVLLMRR